MKMLPTVRKMDLGFFRRLIPLPSSGSTLFEHLVELSFQVHGQSSVQENLQSLHCPNLRSLTFGALPDGHFMEFILRCPHLEEIQLMLPSRDSLDEVSLSQLASTWVQMRNVASLDIVSDKGYRLVHSLLRALRRMTGGEYPLPKLNQLGLYYDTVDAQELLAVIDVRSARIFGQAGC